MSIKKTLLKSEINKQMIWNGNGESEELNKAVENKSQYVKFSTLYYSLWNYVQSSLQSNWIII